MASPTSFPPEPSAAPPGAPAEAGRLRELAGLFLRLGLTAFGGPAAHIALMEDEVVRRRGWMTREHFLDLLGATNLIPGPNSTEMAIHIGHARAGFRGLVVAGLCFIVPAVVMTTALAWAYVAYGTLPAAEALLYGVKPVIIAVVAQALVGLARSAARTPLLAAAGLVAGALALAGANELAVLGGAGLAVAAVRALGRRGRHCCWSGRSRGPRGPSRPGRPPGRPRSVSGACSPSSSRWARCCMAAATCCWPSCGPTWWIATAG